MSLTFESRMTALPPKQKHADPDTSDSEHFLAPLTKDAKADVNLNHFWHDPVVHTQKSGGLVFGLHYPTPGPNGYEKYMVNGRCVFIPKKRLHSEDWSAEEVRTWRRGSTAASDHPLTYWEIQNYCANHGGVPVGDLKYAQFGRYPWIMQDLVEAAHHFNKPPWFKAVPTQVMCEEKCANTIAAHVGDRHGEFALIFGTKVQGRKNRVAAARRITADWDVKPTRTW